MIQTALKLAGLKEPVYENDSTQIETTEIIVQDFDMAETNDNAVDDSAQSAQKKGRPRSEKSRKSILKATNALLLYTSVQDLSIEAIAKKAKVGKTTIYRWWPNKAAIVMDALMSQPGLQKPLSTPSNNAEAIRMQLDKLIHLLNSKNGEVIAQLFSEAQADPKAKEIFEQNFLAPLIDAVEYSVVQGQQNGEFRKALDPKIVVDILCGPVFFRLMSHGQDLDKPFQDNYPTEVVRLISA
ncbi:MAG: TetR/AcrR family transcriptional regulator [Alphaproteobacteria bacterium]